MLTNDILKIDLQAVRQNLKSLLPQEVRAYFDEYQSKTTQLNYPVIAYPSKINSLSLEKQPHFDGILKGIKGQYLIFDDGTVFNVRSSEGFVVQIFV
jgi:hypothetical protein